MGGHGPPQLVGVGDGVGVIVGVGVGTHPLALQASQQLGKAPAHAAPPGGALQWVASRLILHLVAPSAVVTQHETAPGLPQIDFAAQLCTRPVQRGFSCPLSTRVWSTPAEHFT